MTSQDTDRNTGESRINRDDPKHWRIPREDRPGRFSALCHKDNANGMLEAMESAWSAEVAALRESHDEHVTLNGELLREVAALRAELEEWKADATETGQTAARLHAEVAALRDELAERKAIIAAQDEVQGEYIARTENAEAEVERMRSRALEAVGLILAGDLRTAVDVLSNERAAQQESTDA